MLVLTVDYTTQVECLVVHHVQLKRSWLHQIKKPIVDFSVIIGLHYRNFNGPSLTQNLPFGEKY